MFCGVRGFSQRWDAEPAADEQQFDGATKGFVELTEPGKHTLYVRIWDNAGRQTLEFLQEHIPEARTVPLCGNSIGTDRRFLAAYLPEIEEFLHYRSVDVSTIKELAKRWYPSLADTMPHKAGAHRALDDIRESIDELRWWREHVFVAGNGQAGGDGPDRGAASG